MQSPDTTCPDCGWLMWSRHHPGALTADQVALHEAVLSERSRILDMVALLRAVHGPHGIDADVSDELVSLVRHNASADSERMRLNREVEAREEAEYPGDDEAVRRAVDGLALRGDALVLVEAGFDAVSVELLRTDALGVVRRVPSAASTLPWATLWPGVAGLPTAERWFHLAGGIGAGIPPAAEELDTSADRLAGEVTALAPGMPVVLIRRTVGWRLADRFTRRLAGRLRPAAEFTRAREAAPLADRLDELADAVPLRHPYDVVLATVDASGAVATGRHPLFPAGVRAPADGELVVLGAPGATAAAVVPVVATLPDGTHLPLVAHRLPLAPVRPSTVRYRLLAPGRIECLASTSTTVDQREVDRVFAALPATLSPPPRVDLVFAIELGGDTDAVEQRIALAMKSIHVATTSYPRMGGLRVGLVGYAPHQLDERPRPDGEQLLRIQPLQDPARAGAALAGWTPSGRAGYALATSLEDALAASGALEWRHERRVLVVLGVRPPHVHRGPGPVRACPDGVEHARAVAELDRLGVRRVVAGGQPDLATVPLASRRTQEWSRSAWSLVADDRLPADIEPDRLLEALGLGPDPDHAGFALALHAVDGGAP
ncbi:hypothetical protein AB0B31_35415 [Catellatospora citrea]|uniref:hypothetical protein n=1 Tax=Catellatospora citrea TaxID=53366 RepID=UPI0033FADAE4